MPGPRNPIWVIDKQGHSFLKPGDFVEEIGDGFRQVEKRQYRSPDTGQSQWALISCPDKLILPYESVVRFATRFQG